MSSVGYNLLKKQNSETSSAIINLYAGSSDFNFLAKVEGDAILSRDQEDAEKLQIGIDHAKEKGVIDPNFVPEPYVQIDVLGKSPDDVCDSILKHVDASKGSKEDNSGRVIVICGLSGTGKGTTVSKLSDKLSVNQQQVTTWSNGNIFRSVTLLATTWCEIELPDEGFNAEKALTKENLASFISMLSFGKFNGKFDTRIHGLGLDLLVSEVQNTLLKEQKVSKNIPTVAKVTQGEVINYAAGAIKIMSEGGVFILLEGREQTVNYVRTPLRFNLTLSDETLIGKRRAAQRLMASALNVLEDEVTEEQVKKVLDDQLSKLLKEIEN